MPDTKNSHLAKPAANRPGMRLVIGCAAVLVLVLAGLAIAAAILQPSLATRLGIGNATAPVALEDATSPERLTSLREEQLKRLNSYGWVDEEAGIVHIPIDRAIDLLVDQGLPVGQEENHSESDTAPAPAPDLSDVTYQGDILPIFEEHCGECHGAEDPEEGLELTRYRTALVGSINGPVIEPGNPDDSYLVEQIVSGQMPKRGDPLPQAQIDAVVAWIEAGAPEGETTTDVTPEPSADLTDVTYQDDILPIFEEHCGECHGGEDPEEGLELTRYRTALVGSINGPVIEPGYPDDSYLVEQIVSGQMPKRDDPLPQAQIDTIVAWIEAGAPE